LTGVLREEQGRWTVGDSEGRVHPIDRSSIDELLPSAKSAMPEGLLEKLTADQKRDLMTYLLISAPSMPLQSPQGLPALRTAQAIQDVLANSQPLPVPLRNLRMVLVAGPKDHGPNEHDYPAWLVQWGQLLSAAEGVDVEPAWEFPSDAQLSHADVVVFFQKGSWGGERARAMDAYFARGGGAVYLHWAVNGDDQVADFSTRIGLASWGGRIHYRHGPLDLRVDAPEHPILRNVAALDLVDESYWLLTGDLEKIQVLASSHEENAWRPQLWTYEPSHGRVFVSIPGHYSWTFDDPVFRTVLLRGIAWTAREPVDRFNDLVPLGARVSR
jgi:type 1 glutamine amidotransferase